MVFRDRGARGVPNTASDSSAHVFPERPEKGGLADASGRPHLLGCGFNGGRAKGAVLRASCNSQFRSLLLPSNAKRLRAHQKARKPVMQTSERSDLHFMI